MARKLMKGAEALAEAAVRAGGHHYFCYPITPQTEVAEYLARRLPEVGGTFLQAESEVAASNMVYGAAGAGVRAFTTSSSPGISLMTEAFSYIAGAELPAVVANVMRCGPGLGGVLPGQADYFHATKPGHGDYHFLVLAPASVQEMADCMTLAFDLADRYRNPVMVLADGMLAQMMEAVDLPEPRKDPLPEKEWATTGCRGRAPNLVNSLWLDPDKLESVNQRLQDKYRRMREAEVRHDGHRLGEPYRVLFVAFGTTARICQTACDRLCAEDRPAALFRPVTLFPFPDAALRGAAERAETVLVVEMNAGQMLEDVDRALAGMRPLRFHGRTGGHVPTPDEVAGVARSLFS